jgi:hypothetical protein
MNVESRTTLQGLELISMTERRRARVQEAVRVSEMIVSMLLGVGQWFGGSREVQRERHEPHLAAK